MLKIISLKYLNLIILSLQPLNHLMKKIKFIIISIFVLGLFSFSNTSCTSQSANCRSDYSSYRKKAILNNGSNSLKRYKNKKKTAVQKTYYIQNKRKRALK